MTKDSLRIPRRVWINAPSTLQPYHKFHGLRGIAVFVEALNDVAVYFADGPVRSIQVDPLYLSDDV